MREDKGVIVLLTSTEPTGNQAFGLVGVHQVPDDSDDDFPIITFATPRKVTQQGRQRSPVAARPQRGHQLLGERGTQAVGLGAVVPP